MNHQLRLVALVASALVLAGCASGPQRPEGLIDIEASSQGRAVTGATCLVRTLSGSWTVQAPGVANVGAPNGDLHVICEHPAYRTSEVIIRASAAPGAPGGTRVSMGVGGGFGGYSGGGLSLGFGFPIGSARSRYPAKIVVDMTPQNPSQ